MQLVVIEREFEYHANMSTSAYVPPGWPSQVRPPGASGWEATAIAYLLDCCPPDFRAYRVLRNHPIVLAQSPPTLSTASTKRHNGDWPRSAPAWVNTSRQMSWRPQPRLGSSRVLGSPAPSGCRAGGGGSARSGLRSQAVSWLSGWVRCATLRSSELLNT